MTGESGHWTALVLAGSRGPSDPVAAHCGVRHKALAPMAGMPMLARVLASLTASPEIGSIALCLDDPSIVVNVTGDKRASYARTRGKPDAKLVVAKDATSAELDVELKEVAGGNKLRVVGTVRCSTPDVFE